MQFQREVNRMLHHEHRATIALLEQVERAFTHTPTPSPELAGLAGALAQHLEQEMTRHFDFEEQDLFPRVAEAGDGDIVALLADEHVVINERVHELLPLAHAAAANALDASGWTALRRDVPELVERLLAHIHKETMALLPLLEDLIDEETDRTLTMAYASR